MSTKINYLDLTLESPIIVASCGLTNNIENIKEMEAFGAGAVVLKSLFEEQISIEINQMDKAVSNYANYSESYDYIKNNIGNNEINKYLRFIEDAKKEVNIPIIGSINCHSYDKWLSFAKKIENAGADAIELNIDFLPANVNQSADDIEMLYSNIIAAMKKSITIPFSVKCGSYFSDMAKFMQRISWMGISGLTIFNREFKPDIDIHKMEYKSAPIYGNEDDLCNTLRWTAILSDIIRCNLSATGGVQNGKDVIKLLLAGATSVQVASCLHKNGIPYLKELNSDIEKWMKMYNYTNISDFRGKMSLKSAKNPHSLLRVQFMKHYSGIE